MHVRVRTFDNVVKGRVGSKEVTGVYGTLERRYTVQHMVQFYRSNGDTQFSAWYSVVNVAKPIVSFISNSGTVTF